MQICKCANYSNFLEIFDTNRVPFLKPSTLFFKALEYYNFYIYCFSYFLKVTVKQLNIQV